MALNPSQSAIADLSYRNYDGPLSGPGNRWQVIAKAMISKATGMKSYWLFTILAGWYFVVMVVILFFLQQIAASNPTGGTVFQSFVDRLVWKDQFLHGFGFSQHLIMVVTLMVGAGTIANDNRANSLLVYLSKPCRKIDYLIGKWIGVFVPILIVVAIPSFTFYLYGIFSFRDEGFFRSDPWLLVRVLCVLPIAAAIHASLIIAISSLFKQGTVAGAVYAGIYFMGYFFTLLMRVIWFLGKGNAPEAVKNLYYCSIDGIQLGLAKTILQAGDTRPFGIPSPNGGGHPIPAPPLVPFLLIVVVIVAGSIWFSWTRVRAVEVV
jgi:ABC-2 type transport system permease protein